MTSCSVASKLAQKLRMMMISTDHFQTQNVGTVVLALFLAEAHFYFMSSSDDEVFVRPLIDPKTIAFLFSKE